MVIADWLLVTGYCLLVTGYWLLIVGFWFLIIGYGDSGLEPPGGPNGGIVKVLKKNCFKSIPGVRGPILGPLGGLQMVEGFLHHRRVEVVRNKICAKNLYVFTIVQFQQRIDAIFKKLILAL